jgi:hypothetical protein
VQSTLPPRRALLVTVIACLPAVLPGCGPASPPTGADATPGDSPAPASTNAAESYRAIAARLDAAFVKKLQGAGLYKPPIDVQALGVEEQGTAVDELIAATKLPTCDFDVELRQGLGTSFAHLADVNTLGRLLAADGHRCLKAGDTEGAARRAAAGLRLANHLASHARASGESRMAMATASLASRVVVEGGGPLAAAPAAAEIRSALRAVSAADPLGMKASLQSEKELLQYALKNSLFGPEHEALSRRSQAERDAAASEVESAFDKAMQAWDAPDAARQLRALDQASVATLGGSLTPEFAKMRSGVDRIRSELSAASAVVGR